MGEGDRLEIALEIGLGCTGRVSSVLVTVSALHLDWSILTHMPNNQDWCQFTVHLLTIDK